MAVLVSNGLQARDAHPRGDPNVDDRERRDALALGPRVGERSVSALGARSERGSSRRGRREKSRARVAPAVPPGSLARGGCGPRSLSLAIARRPRPAPLSLLPRIRLRPAAGALGRSRRSSSLCEATAPGAPVLTARLVSLVVRQRPETRWHGLRCPSAVRQRAPMPTLSCRPLRRDLDPVRVLPQRVAGCVLLPIIQLIV